MPVLISITPSVIDIPPDEPLPSNITLPLPLGNKLMLPLDTDTISLPLTSKSPPSCGVESSATFDIALDVASPATTALLAMQLNLYLKLLLQKQLLKKCL